MRFDPLALDLAVDAVLECMCSALTATAEEVEGHPPCPCRSCKVAGSLATWTCEHPDRGEDCGQGALHVRVARLYPSTTFPGQDLGADGCAPSTIVAELVVLLLRCRPVTSDENEACGPTCDQEAAAARIQHIDMLSLFRAATCCVPSQAVPGPRTKRRVAIASHRAVGPDELCVGSELTLLVDIGNPCGCGELPTPDPSV